MVRSRTGRTPLRGVELLWEDDRGLLSLEHRANHRGGGRIHKGGTLRGGGELRSVGEDGGPPACVTLSSGL
jgi:hypothetical protein